MTTSTLTLAGSSPLAHAPKLIAMLSAVARKTGAGALQLLRMSAGLDSVNPELFAHRIVHD